MSRAVNTKTRSDHLLVKRGPLLQHLDEIEARCAAGPLSLQNIFEIFGREGHYVLILFMILPFLQPIPLLGLSTPFGILIAMVSVFAYLRRPPWIPKRWAKKQLDPQTVCRISEASERLFEKLSFILHPRWQVFFHGPFPIVSALATVLAAILLALPLPIPFSNMIPAWVVLLQALGQLERDGFFVLLSYVQLAVCLTYFVLIAEGVEKALQWILV